MTDKAVKTYGEKELKLSKIDNSSLFQWAFTSGGELPKELQGRFTGVREAVIAVDAACRRRDAEVKIAIAEAEEAARKEEEAASIKAEAEKIVADKKKAELAEKKRLERKAANAKTK